MRSEYDGEVFMETDLWDCERISLQHTALATLIL